MAVEHRAEPSSPGNLSIHTQRRWMAVVLLSVVGVMNYVDRFLPALLAEPIKRELLLSDTALGLINGFGFLLLYATLGIPIARIADRGNYGPVIAICLTLWSVMTMLGGLAQSGWQLALTRMGVAAGEAGNTPAAHAYISRNFAPDRRATPIALLTLSVPIAGIVGLAGGGILGESLGWRRAFITLGAVNLLLLPLIFVVLRPTKNQLHTPSNREPQARSSVLLLLRNPSFVLILIASGFIGIAGYTMNAFAPAFLMRVHGMSLSHVGVHYGLISGISGIAALGLCALLGDRLARWDSRAPLWFISTLLAACIPVAITALRISDATTAMWLLALSYAPVTAYLVPVVASIQRITPVEMRATASAVLLFFTAVVGGLGPLLAGTISDALQPSLGTQGLARGMLVIPVAQAAAAAIYVAASRRFAREVIQ